MARTQGFGTALESMEAPRFAVPFRAGGGVALGIEIVTVPVGCGADVVETEIAGGGGEAGGGVVAGGSFGVAGGVVAAGSGAGVGVLVAVVEVEDGDDGAVDEVVPLEGCC